MSATKLTAGQTKLAKNLKNEIFFLQRRHGAFVAEAELTGENKDDTGPERERLLAKLQAAKLPEKTKKEILQEGIRGELQGEAQLAAN